MRSIGLPVRGRRGLGFLAALFVGACSSTSPSGPSGNQSQPLGDGGALDAFFGGDIDLDSLPTGSVSCDDDSRVDTYTAHLTKTGAQGVKFEIQSSDPAPPAKGGNTFVVRVTGANGQVMSGDLAANLFMPDHGHGTTVEPVITYDSSTQTYTLDPMYLFMAGVWRIQLTAYTGAADAGPAVDSALFFFCIDG